MLEAPHRRPFCGVAWWVEVSLLACAICGSTQDEFSEFGPLTDLSHAYMSGSAADPHNIATAKAFEDLSEFDLHAVVEFICLPDLGCHSYRFNDDSGSVEKA